MKSKNSKLVMIGAGLATGLATGLLGGGGGMIVVPFFSRVLGKDVRVSHATAILVILPLTAISGIFYAAFGAFEFSVGIPAGIGVIAGGLIGALLLRRMPPSWVMRLFGVVMLLAGIKMLL